jgi:hypothetical protein
MRAIVAFGFLLLLAACGREAGYPDDYRFNFIQACESQQMVAGLCACTWEKIEANVARADFDAAERMSPEQRALTPLQRQIEGYAVECAASLTGGDLGATEPKP